MASLETAAVPGARASSSISTARMAPTGSIRTPSASSTVATRGRSRSSCTSGPMTVGPVTTTRLPKSMAFTNETS